MTRLIKKIVQSLDNIAVPEMLEKDRLKKVPPHLVVVESTGIGAIRVSYPTVLSDCVHSGTCIMYVHTNVCTYMYVCIHIHVCMLCVWYTL